MTNSSDLNLIYDSHAGNMRSMHLRHFFNFVDLLKIIYIQPLLVTNCAFKLSARDHFQRASA